MNNFFEFDSKNAEQMEFLENAKGCDMFVFTEYISPFPCCMQMVMVAHSKSLPEIAAYMRYRVVRNILSLSLNGEFEPEYFNDKTVEELSSGQKMQAKEGIEFWSRLGKCLKGEFSKEEFDKIVEDFNSTFPLLDYATYAFEYFNNASELAEYITQNYSQYHENLKERLEKICTTQNFNAQAFETFYMEEFNGF